MTESIDDTFDTNIYFICGVSGCGKSTIGSALSERIGLPFHDGDDFHPPENVAKMKSGLPLNDEDRKSWLAAINTFISSSETGLIIACSALKEIYRVQLSLGVTRRIHWIFLNGDFELITNRIKSRKDHFMPSALLQSQFDILDIPDYAQVYDIDDTVDEITESITLHKNIDH